MSFKDNQKHCEEIVENLTKEQILKAVVLWAQYEAKKNKDRSKREPWSYVGHCLGHGSGVSSMIVSKYSGDEALELLQKEVAA